MYLPTGPIYPQYDTLNFQVYLQVLGAPPGPPAGAPAGAPQPQNIGLSTSNATGYTLVC